MIYYIFENRKVPLQLINCFISFAGNYNYDSSYSGYGGGYGYNSGGYDYSNGYMGEWVAEIFP